MERVGGDGVEHAVGADRLRLGDVERDAPFGRRLARRPAASTPKYLAPSTSRLCSARGTTVPMITASTSARVEAFELEQLVQPDRILVGGAPRIGRDPPARADHRRPRPARRRGWCCRRRWRAACASSLSDQEHVAGVNDADGAVRQAQPQRAVSSRPSNRPSPSLRGRAACRPDGRRRARRRGSARALLRASAPSQRAKAAASDLERRRPAPARCRRARRGWSRGGPRRSG